jgi:hypothetical protein
VLIPSGAKVAGAGDLRTGKASGSCRGQYHTGRHSTAGQLPAGLAVAELVDVLLTVVAQGQGAADSGVCVIS